MTPKDLLATKVAFSMEDVAAVLELCYVKGAKRGEPNPTLARNLVKAGKLRLIDPSQPPWYWRVSANELRRHLAMPVGRPVAMPNAAAGFVPGLSVAS